MLIFTHRIHGDFWSKGSLNSTHFIQFLRRKIIILWETDFNKSIDKAMLIMDNSSMNVSSCVNKIWINNIIKIYESWAFTLKFESSQEDYFKH